MSRGPACEGARSPRTAARGNCAVTGAARTLPRCEVARRFACTVARTRKLGFGALRKHSDASPAPLLLLLSRPHVFSFARFLARVFAPPPIGVASRPRPTDRRHGCPVVNRHPRGGRRGGGEDRHHRGRPSRPPLYKGCVEARGAVKLEREPTNKVDVNAIRAVGRGGQIGYISKTGAAALAPLMDAGVRFECVANAAIGERDRPDEVAVRLNFFGQKHQREAVRAAQRGGAVSQARVTSALSSPHTIPGPASPEERAVAGIKRGRDD